MSKPIPTRIIELKGSCGHSKKVKVKLYVSASSIECPICGPGYMLLWKREWEETGKEGK